MRDVFIRTLTTLAEKDGRVFLITGDLGFGVLEAFAKRFPRQYLNVGVAEQNMTGIAMGLSLSGRIVFTYSIANFPTLRCFEQLRNDVCYHHANVKVVSIGGGFSYGSLGVSHHATEDIAVLRVLPNLTCIVPSDDFEVERATETLAALPGPGYLRLDKTKLTGVNKPAPFELGRMRVVREGDAATLVASGGIMREVVTAADALESQGLKCRVLSFHTVSTVDEPAVLAAARETGGLITVEEHSIKGGIGGAIAEILLETGARPGFFRRMGLRTGFLDVVGDQSYLQKRCGLDAASIVATVRACIAPVCFPEHGGRDRQRQQ